MQVTKIGYENDKGQEFSAVVIDDSKEEAIKFLRKIVKVERISSTSSMGTVHAIGDNIVNRIIDKNPEVKKWKERVETMKNKNKELEDQLRLVEYDLEQIKLKEDKNQQQPSSAEIAKAMKENNKGRVYVCPYCEFETEKKKGIKMHISKQHKEVTNAGDEDNTPKS